MVCRAVRYSTVFRPSCFHTVSKVKETRARCGLPSQLGDPSPTEDKAALTGPDWSNRYRHTAAAAIEEVTTGRKDAVRYTDRPWKAALSSDAAPSPVPTDSTHTPAAYRTVTSIEFRKAGS